MASAAIQIPQAVRPETRDEEAPEFKAWLADRQRVYVAQMLAETAVQLRRHVEALERAAQDANLKPRHVTSLLNELAWMPPNLKVNQNLATLMEWHALTGKTSIYQD